MRQPRGKAADVSVLQWQSPSVANLTTSLLEAISDRRHCGGMNDPLKTAHQRVEGFNGRGRVVGQRQASTEVAKPDVLRPVMRKSRSYQPNQRTDEFAVAPRIVTADSSKLRL